MSTKRSSTKINIYHNTRRCQGNMKINIFEIRINICHLLDRYFILLDQMLIYIEKLKIAIKNW